MEQVATQAELGDRVREARVALGRTQDELATALHIDRSALARIEAGERKVSALELAALGRVLDLPVTHFLSRPPAAMTSRRKPLDDDASRSERRAYRGDALLEGHLRDAELLRESGYLHPVTDLPGGQADTIERARDLAHAVREFAGQSGPLGGMTEVAEAVGLYILVVAADVEGASLSPNVGYGVSVIGDGAPPGRRRFTAAHEIGHHVLGDEYQTDAGVSASRNDRERLIDSFAAELLLPRATVVSLWPTHGSDPRDVLIEIAATYRVSWQVALQAAVDSDVISVADSVSPLRQVPLRGDFVRVVGAAPVPDLIAAETGPGWRKAVVRAYVNGVITSRRAVEMLHGALDVEDLPLVGMSE